MTDRTPVLIGIGAVSQREPDPERALEPVALMARALERAADDAGSRRWLERADAIAVRDSASIRRTALLRGLPYFTTVAAARAGAGAIRALQNESIGVRSLQEIHPRS